PNTTDWYGRWRPRSSAENDYLMDREKQRTVSYSGIPGIAAEDQAVTESMGGITNRVTEHLAPSDRMIAVTRRRLLDAAMRLKPGDPAPAEDGAAYAGVRGGYFIAKAGKSLLDAYRDAGGVLEKAPA